MGKSYYEAQVKLKNRKLGLNGKRPKVMFQIDPESGSAINDIETSSPAILNNPYK